MFGGSAQMTLITLVGEGANGKAGKNSGTMSAKAALTMGGIFFMRGVYVNYFCVALESVMYTLQTGALRIRRR